MVCTKWNKDVFFDPYQYEANHGCLVYAEKLKPVRARQPPGIRFSNEDKVCWRSKRGSLGEIWAGD